MKSDAFSSDAAPGSEFRLQPAARSEIARASGAGSPDRLKPGLQTTAGRRIVCWLLSILLLAASVGALPAANAVLLGWSEQGLHETDGQDVSVYALMPPYSTIHAQLIVGGALVVASNGVTVTYQAVADASGSMNSTSMGKGNFYAEAQALYGMALAPDQGLAGFAMPGVQNQPQRMAFDPVAHQFTAQGLPLMPYDDQGRPNPLPLLHLEARDRTGALLASTDFAVPVSDQMDCRACHASGTQTDARPLTGWVWECDSNADYKLNILLYHDEIRAGTTNYADVLKWAGYNPAGLYATVKQEGRPVLCIRCHASNALPGSGAPGMRPLTRLIHTKHALVTDPQTGLPLDTRGNSAACLRCHAGPESFYLRGVHHRTVTTNGVLAMQCQSCHGLMADVGNRARQGWLDEPNCQSCHTGTALSNSGQLRYTNVFQSAGHWRAAVDPAFATQTNVPSAGFALYRASQGHGGLACAACHGAAHAEAPSAPTNDSVQSRRLQGSLAALVECSVCHPTTPAIANGGPHGLHPVGPNWARNHGDGDSGGRTQCQTCHGADYRGTELSRMLFSQTYNAIEARLFWEGFQVGCYSCHNGPRGSDDGGGSFNLAAVASDLSPTTVAETPTLVTLQSSDPDGDPLTYRIVSPPAHGAVSLTGYTATYFPAPGFVGGDVFTYAAWDGSVDSNLGNVQVTINPGTYALTARALVPTAALPGVRVPFHATATLTGGPGTLTYDWNFGDGSPHSAQSDPCHVFPTPGDYRWKLTATANGVTQIVRGVVTISPTLGPPLALSLSNAGGLLTLSWPVDRIPIAVETSSDLTQPNGWQPVFDPPIQDGNTMTLQEFILPGNQFYRLRRVP